MVPGPTADAGSWLTRPQESSHRHPQAITPSRAPGTLSARRAPNPFDIKCPPTAYVLNDGGTLNACIDCSLPLSAACRINGPAFLLIEFNNSDCPSFRPSAMVSVSC